MTGHAAEPEPEYTGPPAGTLARRIHGWSWQAFPIGMGTGAVYVLLSGLKNHPPWVTKIEMVFYALNIFLFLTNNTILALQFFLFRNQWKRLILDPVKGVFVPLVVLSFATIIIGTINYLIEPKMMGSEVAFAFFWVYVFFAVLVCFPMLCVWFNQGHDISTFTPAWAFLVFPMMLVGIVAINVLRVLPLESQEALDILIVGYMFQGLGAFITSGYLFVYMLRVMMTGFLSGHQANGAFVACGPPGFTALALLKLGEFASKILPAHNLISADAGDTWKEMSVMFALLLEGVAIFFFLFGILPYFFKVHKHLNEILGCWALTFPNVGFIATFRALGDVFNSQVFWTLHAVFTTLICVTYAVLLSLTIYAFIRGEIFLASHSTVWKDTYNAPSAEQTINSTGAGMTMTFDRVGLDRPLPPTQGKDEYPYMQNEKPGGEYRA